MAGAETRRTYGRAIDAALATWEAHQALRKVEIVKRTDSGADPDIFDSFFGFGAAGAQATF